MAGWGMAGLLGAGLAVLTGRRLGRVGLAVACGVVGFAYGALLDLYTMVSFGGEQSLDRYLVLSARGCRFNVARRGQRGLRPDRRPGAGADADALQDPLRVRVEEAGGAGRRVLFAAGRGCGAGCRDELRRRTRPPAPRASQPGRPAAADQGLAAADAIAYLRAAQNEDVTPGFSPDAQSSAGMTGWATLGLEASGVHPRSLGRAGRTPIAYLRSTIDTIEGAADLERTILVIEAAGLNSALRVTSLVKAAEQRDPNSSWGGQVNPTAFGVLALDAAGSGAASTRLVADPEPRPRRRLGLRPRQQERRRLDRGGAAGAGSGGLSADAVRDGVSCLRSISREGGGFPWSGGGPNAQSTAWAIRA